MGGGGVPTHFVQDSLIFASKQPLILRSDCNLEEDEEQKKKEEKVKEEEKEKEKQKGNEKNEEDEEEESAHEGGDRDDAQPIIFSLIIHAP